MRLNKHLSSQQVVLIRNTIMNSNSPLKMIPQNSKNLNDISYYYL